jgi:predicted MFS family arabinose efflux permease
MTLAAFSMLSPLRVRDYRLQWPADLATSWAFEMEMMLLSWYVLTESNSVLAMTAVGSLHFIGTLFAPLFGVAGDRIGLRNLLCLMRAAYAFNATILLTCALLGTLTVPIVFVVAALTGLVRPSDIGVRSALVAQSVAAGILPNAMGLSRTTYDSARIFAALTGAGLFAAFGMASAYTLVAVCYVLGLVLTLAISRPATGAAHALAGAPRRPSPFRDLVEGVSYIWRAPKLQAAMWLACLVNLTAFPLSIGLTAYAARNVLGGDEILLGYLLASFASGSLIGSLVIMTQRIRLRPERLMLVCAVIWHLFLVWFANADTRWGAMVALFGAGMAQSLSMVSMALMLLQTAEPRLRGRVMGVRMMAIYSLPVGLMCAGALIPLVGFTATATGYAVAGILLTIAIGFGWRHSIWHEPQVPVIAQPTAAADPSRGGFD